MGQCPCGELFLIRAFRLPGSDLVLAVDEHHGCRHCGNPPGFTLHAFTPQDWETWGKVGSGSGSKQAEGTGTVPVPTASCCCRLPLEIERLDGADNEGFGWWLPFVGPQDLARGAAADEHLRDVALDEYATLADLLEGHGLRILQAALRHREKP